MKELATGGWRNLRNEDIHNVYSTRIIIIRVIKWRRMRLAGHVAGMGHMRNVYKIMIEKSECLGCLKKLGIGWRIILKWIASKYDVSFWAGLFCVTRRQIKWSD
jgi:hypothetical protein